MHKFKLLIALSVLLGLWSPVAFADSFTTSVQKLLPGNSVMAKNRLTFSMNVTGFQAQSYQVADSFSGSSVSNTDFDGGGNFQWVPLVSDVGTHVLTITSRDYSDDSASTQLTLTVLPPPSVSIQSVSSKAIAAGQKFTFSVLQTGFTNASYLVGDVFSGSSVNAQNLDASGNFSWTPDLSQNGKHTITIYASDSLGHGAQASVDVQVGAGPSLLVQPVTPGTTINAGVTVSFTVAAINFIPTGFTVSDSVAGSSIGNGNINSSGSFVWTPSGSDVGAHVLSFKGQVGAYGDSATTTETLMVVASGASTSSPPVSTVPLPMPASSSSALILLQAQLAALNAKIKGQTSGAAQGSSAGGVTFDTYLKPGSQGEEVTALQKILIQDGYLSGDATGHYGSLTVDAVIKFQAAHGLTQLGVVGPATRAALNALGSGAQSSGSTTATTNVVTANGDGFVFQHFMGYGDDDPDVLELQQRLVSLGYLTATPSGFYGNATVSAVKKFQSTHSLTATGYADKTTRTALNQ
jgi:peptidoglycan hydrolase-like protein with peptidoglycan-binding domain